MPHTYDAIYRHITSMPLIFLSDLRLTVALWRKRQADAVVVGRMIGLPDLTDADFREVDDTRIGVECQLEWHAKQLGIIGEGPLVGPGPIIDWLVGSQGAHSAGVYATPIRDVLATMKKALGVPEEVVEYSKPRPLEDWAAAYGIKKNAMSRWFKTGQVEAKKLGGMWAVAVRDLPGK